METSGGHEIPLRPAADQGSKAWRQGYCACPAHWRVSWEPGGTGPHLHPFQRQDCFTGDSVMTTTYPFPVSGDEFKGKRVLVTGGTKGMGQAMVRRFTLSGASVATTARSPLSDGQAVALFVQTGYRYGCRRARCNQSHSTGVGWTRHPGEQCRRVGCSERRI